VLFFLGIAPDFDFNLRHEPAVDECYVEALSQLEMVVPISTNVSLICQRDLVSVFAMSDG
jgi:hypothetical protein